MMVENVLHWTDSNKNHWTNNMDIAGHICKNLSYEENYHQKYYYPQIVHKQILSHCREHSEAIIGQSGIDGDIKPMCFAGLDIYNKSNSVAKNSCLKKGKLGEPAKSHSTQMCDTCSWYTSPDPRPSRRRRDTEKAPTIYPTLTASRLLSADTMESSAVGLSNFDLNHSRVKFVTSSNSVTSEDSVFSDDYSIMTDVSDDLNSPDSLFSGAKCRHFDSGSEGEDSSFSSRCSSTSTLEADGNEYGGSVEDDGIKVRELHAGCTPPAKSKYRPRLLKVGNPQFAFEGCSGSCTCNPDMAEQNLVSNGPLEGEKTARSTSVYEDREFDFLKTEPNRRSISLKTYKTPPGTPHRKKAVRFADALGLDLESVRHILNLEEPPEVPKSAMIDLKVGLEKDHKSEGVKYLSALFSQPSTDPMFIQRVKDKKVALENCLVHDKDMTVSGTIRVSNVAFDKTVLIRYTTNSWLTHDDVAANYVQNSNDSQTDRFSFTVTVPKYFAVGQRMEFAVMFITEGRTFWDNNFSRNYAIECYARAMPTCESDNTWMHFL